MIDIPGSKSFMKIEPLHKGWSNDQKFYIETFDGRRLLLRVADISEYDRKKAEYGMMERVAALGVPMSRPMDFGLCDGGRRTYSLLTWCDGEDVAAVLPRAAEAERYALGVKAGKLLRKIHTLPPPENAEPWGARFRRKVAKRLDYYGASAVKSESGAKIARHLLSHQYLLDGRPQTFNHGDYNASNLIVSPEGEIGAIDFNYFNLDCGDPWWELDSISWGEEPCAHFHTGLINGYFDGAPTRGFFDMLTYYLAYDAMAALCDTSQGEQGAPEDGRRHVENTLRWLDDMRSTVPTWYLR